MKRGENFVVETAIFKIANSHFNVHFETYLGCNDKLSCRKEAPRCFVSV